jgi:predicted alpha/beta superfamily hydrolase
MKKQLLLILAITFLSNFENALQAQNSTSIADSIYSNTLNEQRKFWVQLPENYNSKSDIKYPVIYVLDGFSLQDELTMVYNNYWGHYLPNMILVGIGNRNNRIRDLTTSQIKMRRGTSFDQETGGAENFTQFIAKELMPHIDREYKTTAYRTLIGHSYAGLFTINMLVNHTHLFNNYIAIDPSIEWDNQKLLKQAKAKLQTERFSGKSLFVSLAAEQLHMWDEKITMDNIKEDTSKFTLFARSIIDFSEFATNQSQNELNFSWKVYPEDLHGTVPLPSMRDGLVFLFNWYQFKNPPKYNNPETTVDELRVLLKKQEAIYTNNFGYPTPPMIEELFSAYGYMNMQMGAPEKAEFFFKKSVEYYPNNANNYDSLAEYYESQNDNKNALKFATKAFEISGSDQHKEKAEKLKVKLAEN